jgi:putative ATP-dependent endonuclease of the OLD family
LYLKSITARNFRVFGGTAAAPALDWTLSPGLNMLVGENDAGKSAVIDAIRHVLWTTSYEYIRLQETDFHVAGTARATSLTIEATLGKLTKEQESAVLEWLSYGADGSTELVLHLSARRIPAHANKRARIEVVTRCGKNGEGPEVGSAVRDLVRATYLRPLRDAEAELSPGKLSRLSQILGAHKQIAGQEKNDFDAGNPTNVPANLVGLMAFAQHHLGGHAVVKGVEAEINTQYLSEFAFAGDALAARIRIAPDLSLQAILEKFELSLQPSAHIDPSERCPRGLGYNNALFMATELVLLSDGEELALLLVEEPEAHLHPQLQERVQLLLEKKATTPEDGRRPVQVIMTTHSPSLAAGVDVGNMTLVSNGRLFSLNRGETKLKHSDYEFLRRFLDATKANLFFARGIAIVEGPAEALLLPALAKACGRSFSNFGVSVVNVGGVGLYHYARILQRADEKVVLPIPVVCITDRDVVPDVANDYVEKAKKGKRFVSDYGPGEIDALVKSKVERAQGGSTVVEVSDHWTFEYDLAYYGLSELMFKAIALAKAAQARGELLDEAAELAAQTKADEDWKTLEGAAHRQDKLAAIVYRPLQQKEASKAVAAQYAAHLLAAKHYGEGQALFDKLPPYLQAALNHLTPAAKAK